MKKITVLSLFIILIFGAVFFLRGKDNNKIIITNTQDSPEDVLKNDESGEIYEFHPDSLPAISKKDFQGGSLKLGRILDSNNDYTRYYITYQSEGLLISGIMNVPEGEGNFPVLILNHGYIDPVVYTNGRGLKREQDYFARRGYIVIHSDYRGHADSDPDPFEKVRPRTGFTEDVINVISAVKNSELAFFDKENIGMMGHSMGGGIALNIMVTKPDLVKAYVLLAPISAEYRKNFDRWVAPDMSDIAKKTLERYGTFEGNPEFWASVSAINYFSDISDPIMLHQGTSDKDVPLEWSQDLNEDLGNEGKDITYFEYPGEGHTFFSAQAIVMQRSLDFFDDNLKE